MSLTEDAPPRRRKRSRRSRAPAAETLFDWLILAGAATLFVSLFLVWSHQFSPQVLRELDNAVALRGVPREPTAWQVYSAVDVALALVAGALALSALIGGRRARITVALAAGIALAFVLHARSVPPTNGANLSGASIGAAQYVPNHPRPGPGETVAIAGLAVALVGLVGSVIVD